MTPDTDIRGAAASLGFDPEEELGRRRLAWMRHLFASLSASRTALLAMDLPALERATREQFVLSRELATFVRETRPSSAYVRDSLLVHAPDAKHESTLTGELRRVESDVVQALLLQSALLVRMQRKIRVMANMLADRSLNYGPGPERSGAWPRTLTEAQGQQV
jgi:hypothetical protein